MSVDFFKMRTAYQLLIQNDPQVKFDFSTIGLLRISHLRFKRLWIAVGVALIATIFIGSVSSIPTEIKHFMLQDKFMHVLAYGCLMGWFAQIFRHDLTRLLLVILFVVMGIFIEVLQSMTPTRQFEVMDMIANTSGVVLAWALAYTWVGTLLSKFENLLDFKHVS